MTGWMATLIFLAGADPEGGLPGLSLPSGGPREESSGQVSEQSPSERRTVRPKAAPRSDFVDFSRLEVEPRGGFLFFSEDFEADPEFCGELFLRVPMPWLSPKSNPGGEYFGIFAHAAFSSIDRDPDFEMEDPSGSLIFFGAGADYSFLSRGAWRVSAQLGFQYEYFGGVTDLEDGFAATLGLSGTWHLGKGLRVDLNPRFYLADAGDWIAGIFLGLSYEF